MKIAASSYSFSQAFRDGRYNQMTCIAKAKEMGFDAVEFVGLTPQDGSSPMEYAKSLREECQRRSMPISNYTIGADFLNCADLDDEIQRVKGEIDMAVALGATSVRHDATVGYPKGAYKSFDSILPVSYTHLDVYKRQATSLLLIV